MSTPSSPAKLLLLTNLASPHSIKWVRGLASRGHEVIVFSLSPYNERNYADLDGFTGYTLGLGNKLVKTTSGKLGKVVYFRSLAVIRKIIKEHRPDIMHAHRASSYGLLGALSGFHPYVVSVWGDDVYVFPERNLLFRRIIRFVLGRADRVLSTSHVMARQTAKYTDKEIEVTPFGIDMQHFRPEEGTGGANAGAITVGTIKTLEDKYGIDYLIRAFARVTAAKPDRTLHLLIVGEGSRKSAYLQLVEDLGVAEKVTFTGRIPFEQIPDYHRRIDIFAALSTIDAESFGVSIIEASASARPVVVSDAGGPAEVVVDGETGFIVPKRNEESAAKAILKLVESADLRRRMGENGRKHVSNLYDWKDNLTLMTDIYKSILK